MTRYLLLPSALVGAVTWAAVAERLQESAEEVVVADPAGRRTPEDVLEAYVAAAPSPATDLVVVPHSNAGLFAPAVVAAAGADAVVYVDAALAPAHGPASLAPPELMTMLTGLADADGVLPPWSRWWEDASGLFPDEATRTRVEAAEPRLPLGYFRSALPVPAGWEATPSGYLAFGDTYADEQARARSLGWPVRRLEGGHLHLLHDPGACARAISELAAAVKG